MALSSIDTPLFFLLLEKRKGEWEKRSQSTLLLLFLLLRPSVVVVAVAACSRSLLSVCENVCQSVRDPFQSPDPPRLLFLFPRLFRRMPPRQGGATRQTKGEYIFADEEEGKNLLYLDLGTS